MTDTKCPCCGQALDGDLPARVLNDVALPIIARRIVDALIEAHPRGLSRQKLVSKVYSYDPSGGPDTAENIISVTINRTRPMLVPFGWTISDGRRGHRDTRLIPAPYGKMLKKGLTVGGETVSP